MGFIGRMYKQEAVNIAANFEEKQPLRALYTNSYILFLLTYLDASVYFMSRLLLNTWEYLVVQER